MDQDLSASSSSAEVRDAHTLAYEGDLAALQRLANVAPIDRCRKDAHGRTVLYSACRGAQCSPAVVAYLLYDCPKDTDMKSFTDTVQLACRTSSTHAESFPQHAAVAAWKDLLSSGLAEEGAAERVRAILLDLKVSGGDFDAKNGFGMTAMQEFSLLTNHPASIRIAEALGSTPSSGQHIASFLLHRSLMQMLLVIHPEEVQTTQKGTIWSLVDWTGIQAWPEDQWLMYTSQARFVVPSANEGKATKAQLKVSLLRTSGTASLLSSHLFDFCDSELRYVMLPLGYTLVETITVPVSLPGIEHEIASSGHTSFLFGEEMHEQLRFEIEIDRLPQIGHLVLTAPLRTLYPSEGFWPILPHVLLFDAIRAGCCEVMALPKALDRISRLLAGTSSIDAEDDMLLRWSGDAFIRFEYWGSDARMLQGAENWTVPWMQTLPVSCSRPDSRAWMPSTGSAEARSECSARELYRWFAKTLVLEARKLGHAAELDFVRIVRNPSCTLPNSPSLI